MTYKQFCAYLKYVIKHKWYVLVECYKMGILFRGLIHDWSKLLPSELIPYTNYFYTPEGKSKHENGTIGYCKPEDTGDKKFEFSILLHIKRHDHHWQSWIIAKNAGTALTIFPMSDKARKEMLCDWIGAGKAQKTRGVRFWWVRNKNKLCLHHETKKWIEEEIKKM